MSQTRYGRLWQHAVGTSMGWCSTPNGARKAGMFMNICAQKNVVESMSSSGWCLGNAASESLFARLDRHNRVRRHSNRLARPNDLRGDSTRATKSFLRALDGAGLRRFRLHDLRHFLPRPNCFRLVSRSRSCRNVLIINGTRPRPTSTHTWSHPATRTPRT